MSCKEILEQALKLKPAERFMVLEGIIKSLDTPPDVSIDAVWAEKAEKRLAAYRAGYLEGIPIENIFLEEKRQNKSITGVSVQEDQAKKARRKIRELSE